MVETITERIFTVIISGDEVNIDSDSVKLILEDQYPLKNIEVKEI